MCSMGEISVWSHVYMSTPNAHLSPHAKCKCNRPCLFRSPSMHSIQLPCPISVCFQMYMYVFLDQLLALGNELPSSQQMFITSWPWFMYYMLEKSICIDEVEVGSPYIDEVEVGSPYIDEVEVGSPYIDEVEVGSPYIDEVEVGSPYIDEVEVDSPYIDEVEVGSPYIDEVEVGSPYIDEVEVGSPYIDEV